MIEYTGTFSTSKSIELWFLNILIFNVFSKYDEALEILMHNDSCDIRKHTVQSVGIEYLDFLLGKEMYDEAGRLGLKIFGKNPSLWEDQIYKFARVHQLR